MSELISVSERLADRVAALVPERIPAEVRSRCEELLIELGGLCVAARNTDYVRALLGSVDPGGPCSAIGHTGGFNAEDAAMINGTAAHGEDFDDTFEGGPVHSGAVILPAVLAACERFGRDGRAALLGIAVGVEALCRMSLVAPKLIHKAGFHPTSVLGAMASTLAVSTTLGLDRRQTVAARVGLHAARIGARGFLGPRTVFEATHGLYHGFAHTAQGDFDALTRDFGSQWLMSGITFKPYATGTMNQPYIDCALRLALTAKVRYVVDPADPYPKAYAGHVRMTLRDGRVFEERQPHIRGGMHEPLSREELENKFRGNARYGGWTDERADAYLRFARGAFDGALGLAAFREG